MANEVKWIKIVVDIFSDDKIMMIESLPDADTIIVIWFKLLCLAGKSNNGGIFLFHGKIAYTEEMLCAIFRRPLNTIRFALKTFEEYGMIEVLEGVITIPNWDKHQNESALTEMREYNRLAKQTERERKKLLLNEEKENVIDKSMTSQEIPLYLSSSSDVLNPNSKVPSTKVKNFQPPTLDEVAAYCFEKKYAIDPEAFIAFYASKGWKVGTVKMVDWKMAVVGWVKREKTGFTDTKPKPAFAKKKHNDIIE